MSECEASNQFWDGKTWMEERLKPAKTECFRDSQDMRDEVFK